MRHLGLFSDSSFFLNMNLSHRKTFFSFLLNFDFTHSDEFFTCIIEKVLQKLFFLLTDFLNIFIPNSKFFFCKTK